MPYAKIIIPTTPHPDVVVGIFLLKKLGEQKYPGVAGATVETMQELPAGQDAASLEKDGILALDVGGGKFDHHGKDHNLSRLIAEDLGILKDPAVGKLLAYAERDDKFGKGTISQDPLDKAFGLSGLLAALNKNNPTGNPSAVVSAIFPLLEAHYAEEHKRTHELPAEFKKQLAEEDAEQFTVSQAGQPLKVVVMKSDNLSMAGWLKSSIGVKADIVCQRMSSGYTNIITKQQKQINLRKLVALIRNDEFQLRERHVPLSFADLEKPGKIPEIPEWHYDTATNSMLNGGSNPKGIEPTIIPLSRIKEIIKQSFS